MAVEEKDDKGGKNGAEAAYVPEFDVVEGDPNKVKADDDKKGAGYSDERLSADQRDDDDDSPDPEEVALDAGDESNADTEKKREKRRAERRAQKARQTAARDRDKRELSFLRNRNEQVERRLDLIEKTTNAANKRAGQTELAVVEGRIQQLNAAQIECDTALAAAIEANNGADVVKLNRAQAELRDGLKRLAGYQARLKAAPVETADEDAGGGEEEVRREVVDPGFDMSPGVVKNAKVFAQRHPWVNPRGGDQDSNIVKVLDAAVLEEGFKPASKEYWQELESRMQAALPHRFKDSKADDANGDDDEDDETPPRKNGGGKPSKNGGGGPRMPSGSQNRGGNGHKFYLSAERKSAMIEAGVWDDPVLRDKQLRQYRKWDQDNADLLKSGRQ